MEEISDRLLLVSFQPLTFDLIQTSSGSSSLSYYILTSPFLLSFAPLCALCAPLKGVLKRAFALDVAHSMRRAVGERYANFECRLYEASQISKHGLFICEVVKAHVATSPKYTETVHYRGDAVLMISGRNVRRRSQFKAQNF
jgi:hypothetical protein